MLLKHWLRMSYLIMNCIISANAIHADEVVKLKIMASSHSQTEVLMIQQVGNVVTWKIIFPQGLGARGPGHSDGHAVGEVNIDLSSIRKEFVTLINLQTDSKQRERLQDKPPSWPTFVLFLESESDSLISWPLTDQEQKALIRTELMKRVFEDINSRKVLLKPHHLLDFFEPDCRRSLVE